MEPIHFSFLTTEHLCEFRRGQSPPAGAFNTSGVFKFRDFRPIFGYIYETIQDNAIVSMER